MSIDFRVDIGNLNKLGVLVPQMIPIIEDEMGKAMTETGMLLTTLVASRMTAHSKDTGILAASVGWPEGFLQKGSGVSLFGQVRASNRVSQFGVAASMYAVPVEVGSKPHPVPLEPLILWATRKFGLVDEEAVAAGKAIARRIAAHGTFAKGNFFLAWYHDGGEKKTTELWNRVPVRVIKRWEALG